MATAEVDIYNLALSAVGGTASVSSPTEVSREAELCNQWFEPVRDKILAAAQWPSARKTQRLAVLKERDFSADWASDDPEPPWRYAYAYPSDMLRPRFLYGFDRFITGLTNGNRSILTHKEDAILVFTMKQTNIASWDAELQMAVVFGLAAHISLSLNGKDNRTTNMLQQANNLIFEARIGAGNQDDYQLESIPDWIAARGYANEQVSSYVYPDGPVLTLPNNG